MLRGRIKMDINSRANNYTGRDRLLFGEYYSFFNLPVVWFKKINLIIFLFLQKIFRINQNILEKHT